MDGGNKEGDAEKEKRRQKADSIRNIILIESHISRSNNFSNHALARLKYRTVQYNVSWRIISNNLDPSFHNETD